MKKAKEDAKEDARKECPKCGSELRTCWVEDRKLRKECSNRDYSDRDYCGWLGEPYVPPKKPIPRTQDAFTVSGSWEYEGFDKYGHTFKVSEGFSSKAACLAAAKKEIARINALKTECGTCVAVVWPPRTKVRGILVK